MIYRSKRYIALLLTSFALCSYFPELEHYELDNGIDIVLSPNYDVRYANIGFLLNHGKIDQLRFARIQETYLQIFEMFNMPATTRKVKEINQDFSMMGLSGKVFDPNIVSASHTILSDQILPEDMESMLLLTREILTETKIKRDKPVIQRIQNFFFGWIVRWSLDLTTDNFMISDMHAMSMLYGVPIIKLDYNRYINNRKKRSLQWFKEMLGPENLTIMVSGNINIAHTKILLENIYGDIDGTKYNPIKLRSYSPVENTKLRFIKHERFLTDRGSNSVFLGFGATAPAYGTEDYYPYMLAYRYLFDDDSDLLGNYIKKEQSDNSMVFDSYLYESSPRIPYIHFSVYADSSAADSVYAGITETLESLFDRGFTSSNLADANDILAREAYEAYNSPSEFSVRFLDSFSNDHDPDRVQNEMERLQSVDLDELNRVFRKYFNPQDFSVIVMGDPSNQFDFYKSYSTIEYVDRYGSPLETQEPK